MKSKPFNVPTSSPSTKTVPSNLITASKLLYSLNVLLRITIRLSTNLWVNLLCNSSDNLSSIVLACSCQYSDSFNQFFLLVIKVQVLIFDILFNRVSISPSKLFSLLIWDLIQSLSNLPWDNNNSKVFSSKLKCIPDNELLKSGI